MLLQRAGLDRVQRTMRRTITDEVSKVGVLCVQMESAAVGWASAHSCLNTGLQKCMQIATGNPRDGCVSAGGRVDSLRFLQRLRSGLCLRCQRPGAPCMGCLLRIWREWGRPQEPRQEKGKCARRRVWRHTGPPMSLGQRLWSHRAPARAHYPRPERLSRCPPAEVHHWLRVAQQQRRWHALCPHSRSRRRRMAPAHQGEEPSPWQRPLLRRQWPRLWRRTARRCSKRRPPAPGRQRAGNEPGQACGALTRRSLMAQAAAGRPGLPAQASGLLTRRSLAERQAGHAGAPYQAPMGLPAPQRRTGEQRTGQLTLRRSLASVGLIPKPGPAQSISGSAQAAAHACELPRAPLPTPRRPEANAGGHASGTAGARTHRALASGRAAAPPLSMPCGGELITTRPSLVALGTPRGIAGRARASPGSVPAPTRAPALSLQGSLTVRSAAVGPPAHTQPSEEDEPVAQEEGKGGRQASVGVDAEAAGPAARLAALGQATGLLPAQVAAHEQFEGICNKYYSKAAVTGRLIACTDVACTAKQLQSKPRQSVFVAGCALCAVPGRYTLQGLWGS